MPSRAVGEHRHPTEHNDRLKLVGAGGNALDGIVRGYVVDYLDVHWPDWHWPAFKIAAFQPIEIATLDIQRSKSYDRGSAASATARRIHSTEFAIGVVQVMGPHQL